MFDPGGSIIAILALVAAVGALDTSADGWHITALKLPLPHCRGCAGSSTAA